MKKLLSWLASMRLALALMGIILLACVIGGIVPQNAQSVQYAELYGEGLAQAIQFLHLHKVFTAWWFVALMGLLLVNLLLCSILRFPQVYRQYQEGYCLQRRLSAKQLSFSYPCTHEIGQQFLKKMGFGKLKAVQDIEGQQYLYGVRRRFGVWGSWLSHLGMLVVVIGFALGQMLHFETSVYGVPGQRLSVPGTDLDVRIDAFDIHLREDHTVEQYETSLTVYNQDGRQVSGVSRVNAPLHAFGKSFLQNATGWTCTLTTWQGEELLDERILFAGESLELKELNPDARDLVLVFHALYPDYIRGAKGPATRSPYLNNPAALFSLYYQGKLVDMNVAGMGYDIKAADTCFVLSAPQPYTLLQIVADPTLPLVASGGVLMLAGLFLAFYWRPEEGWMLLSEETCTVHGYSRKGSTLFANKAAIIFKEVI
ncbi:MAG: cytochrome c biogenesis protein ResB [Christensenellales bacterium]